MYTYIKKKNQVRHSITFLVRGKINHTEWYEVLYKWTGPTKRSVNIDEKEGASTKNLRCLLEVA